MFYITTPIYYPNGEPHLGHVYTTIACDVLARWHRLIGEETYFLTGTDEHGIKMVKTAAEEKTTPLELATRNSNVFRSIFAEFGISNDDFIRTSEDRHKLAVQQLVSQMIATGDIYQGDYEGWYDEGQEEFITETTAKDQEYKSKISGKPLVRYKEKTYFFKLTKYASKVYALIESDEIKVRPTSRKNEILSKIKDWNEDLSISRGSLTWGIPMPNDPSHVLYVWIDALSNYVTALGLDSQKYKAFWPRAHHVIGKEILWFHAFYWPAMLLAVGRELPKVLFAHGWWTSEGKKMSKSMGNFVDLAKLREIVAQMGIDPLRFYLLRTAPFGNDLDFSQTELANSYAELGNVVGNLLNRTLNMVGKYRGGVPSKGASGPEDAALEQAIDQLTGKLAKSYDEFALQDAVLLPLEVARAANTYIDQTRPFSLAKEPALSARLDTVLNLITRATQLTLAGLIPILPTKATQGLAQLGIDPVGKTFARLIEPLAPNHKLGEAKVLFPRLEPSKK